MKTLFCVLSLALLCGCNGQSTLTTLIKRPSGPPLDYIEALKAEARHSHRYWTIFCLRGSATDDQFQAELCVKDCVTFADGEEDWWAAQGATQQDAAKNLLLSGRFHPKYPQPTYASTIEKECPPTLSGGPE